MTKLWLHAARGGVGGWGKTSTCWMCRKEACPEEICWRTDHIDLCILVGFCLVWKGEGRQTLKWERSPKIVFAQKFKIFVSALYITRWWVKAFKVSEQERERERERERFFFLSLWKIKIISERHHMTENALASLGLFFFFRCWICENRLFILLHHSYWGVQFFGRQKFLSEFGKQQQSGIGKSGDSSRVPSCCPVPGKHCRFVRTPRPWKKQMRAFSRIFTLTSLWFCPTLLWISGHHFWIAKVPAWCHLHRWDTKVQFNRSIHWYSVKSLAYLLVFQSGLYFAAGYCYWIGLSDHGVEGSWFWETGASLGHAQWAAGDPNDAGGTEDCVFMFQPASYLWADGPCSWQCGAICELHWFSSTVRLL